MNLCIQCLSVHLSHIVTFNTSWGPYKIRWSTLHLLAVCAFYTARYASAKHNASPLIHISMFKESWPPHLHMNVK